MRISSYFGRIYAVFTDISCTNTGVGRKPRTSKNFYDQIEKVKLLPIDTRLQQVATKLGVRLVTKDERGVMLPSNYEMRKINWMVGDINASIQIFPTIKSHNDQIKKWNFNWVAWKDKDGVRYIKYERLVDNGTLNQVIQNIDDLLRKSLDSLSKISFSDLRPAGQNN